MTSSTDMNLVLGQGSLVKEVVHVRKEHLELNQHFVVQNAKEEKSADKTKVKKSETDNRVVIEEKRERKGKEESHDRERQARDGKSGADLEGRVEKIIDVTV